MGMKCLIIAAGKGSRLQPRGDSKPLIPILGIPLIERVVRAALEAGADEFYVVTGYQGDRVRTFLEQLSQRLEIHITPIVNGDWEKDNGLSVLKARDQLREPFLLLMADHLFDPALARKLIGLSLNDGEIALGVDVNTQNPIIDMEDVTRVKTGGGKICNIGKNLVDFTGFDSGVFLCTPAIFDALEQCKEKNGDTTLSGAVRTLAADGRAYAITFSGHIWIDVDTPAAFKRAESVLLYEMRGKTNDGRVSRYINRPLSGRITRRLVNYRISPNQISMISFLCAVLAAGLFILGGYPTLLLGGFLAQFASIIDGCDGEVARLKFQSSRYGGWFDAVLDRYADGLLLFGLTWHVYSVKGDTLVLLIGFLAIIGSFMVSYTADKYDGLKRERSGRRGRAIRLAGRDSRLFLIFLGAVFNQVYLTLAVIAAVMNLETIRRIITYRDHA